MAVSRVEILNLLKEVFLFRGIPEDQLDGIVDTLDVVNLEDGDLIYEEGAPANYLFIIYDGQVHLSRTDGEEKQVFGTYTRSDAFGFEVDLDQRSTRRMTASAVGDVILLRLERKNLHTLLDAYDGLEPPFRILQESYLLGERVNLSWLHEDETLYFISRRHSVFLLLRLLAPFLFGAVTLPLLAFFYFSAKDMLLPLILIGLDLIILLFWTLWNVIDWGNDYSIITSQRAVFQEKVIMLYESRNEVLLSAIRSVDIFTDLLGRTLGYGDVVIHAYAVDIVLSRVTNPAFVKSLLEEQRLRFTRTEQVRDHESYKQRLRKRIQTPVQTVTINRIQPQAAPQSAAKSRPLLQNLFEMRFEQGNTVTYRTHWFLLFLKLFFPTLVGVGLLALLVARLVNAFEFISTGTVLALVFLVGIIDFLWWLYQYVDWQNDVYIITPEKIIDVYKKPLGTEERREAALKMVEAVRFERIGLIGQLINFGTVYARVGQAEFTFDRVYNPSEVQSELQRRMAERDVRERKAQRDQQDDWMLDRAAAYYEEYGQTPDINLDGDNPPPPEYY